MKILQIWKFFDLYPSDSWILYRIISAWKFEKLSWISCRKLSCWFLKIVLNIMLKIILLIFKYWVENSWICVREKLKLTWQKLSIWNSLEKCFFSPCRPWFSTSRTEFNPVKFALELKILRTTDGFVKCGGQALALEFLRNYSQKAIFFYKFLYFSKRKMAFCLV